MMHPCDCLSPCQSSSICCALWAGSGGSTGSATLESLMDRVPFHNRPKIVDLTTETKLADGIRETQLLCGEVCCLI